MNDPYGILGVTKNSTDDEIKKAYRTLAKKYHPDLNPNKKEAEQKFKEVSTAYKIIANKESREKFEKDGYNEQFDGASNRSGPFNSDFQNKGGRYSHHFDGDAEDLFKSFFSGFKGEGTIDMPGQDHLYSMEIDLKDSVTGIEKEIMLSNSRKLRVKIPAGISNKEKLKFKNQGGSGIGKGSPGDAYVEILIRPSDLFKINGSNLEIVLQLNLDEAVNGSKIKIPTIDGSVMVNIPAGVNTGSRLRLKGRGIHSQKNKIRGDLIIILNVILPDKPDKEFMDFIKNWCGSHSYNPRKIH